MFKVDSNKFYLYALMFKDVLNHGHTPANPHVQPSYWKTGSRLGPFSRSKNPNHFFQIPCKTTQPVFTCSKLTMEIPEQCVKFVQS